MKLKSVILVVIIVTLSAVAILTIIAVKKNLEKKKLPDITLADVFRNETYSLLDNNKKRTLILFFDPECDLCHDKVILLSENCNLFQDTRLFMISAASKENIISFFTNNKINICNNIFIISTLEQVMEKEFENPITPSIYLYNEKNVLIKKFSYISKINEILNSLKN